MTLSSYSKLPDEKAGMKAGLAVADIVTTETLVAVPRKEAIKLIE